MKHQHGKDKLDKHNLHIFDIFEIDVRFSLMSLGAQSRDSGEEVDWCLLLCLCLLH